MTSPEEASISASFLDEEPACATLRPQPGVGPWRGLAVERLELVSRGDLVNGVLVAAAGASRPPQGSRPALLLLAHDAAASAHAAEHDRVASWLGPTLGLVAIDLPLHGHRASPKLSERLVGAIAMRARGGSLDRNGAVLVEEFVRQAVADWRRTLDAVLALDRFDAKRVGFLGLGLGAWIGGAWLASEARVCAAVLAGRRTAPMPLLSNGVPDGMPNGGPGAAENASAAQTCGLDLERSGESWPTLARPFLASRLGF
jgi:hypothetical protein